MEILVNESVEWQIRQMAAIELKKRVTKFWTDLASDLKNGIKEALIKLVLTPSKDGVVANAVARVIASVAKLEVPLGKWPDLQKVLLDCAQSENVHHREVNKNQIILFFSDNIKINEYFILIDRNLCVNDFDTIYSRHVTTSFQHVNRFISTSFE